MEEDSRQLPVFADPDDLSERESLLFDVTNSQAYKAGTFAAPLCILTLLQASTGFELLSSTNDVAEEVSHNCLHTALT